MLPTNEQLADIFATSTLMAMRERINVPREVLADLLGNDHDKRIMAERHLLAMLAALKAHPGAVDDRAAFEAECGRLGLTLHAGSDCRYAKEIQCAWMLWQAQTKIVNKKALDLIDRVYKNHGQWLEKDPFLCELRTLLAKGVSNEG